MRRTIRIAETVHFVVEWEGPDEQEAYLAAVADMAATSKLLELTDNQQPLDLTVTYTVDQTTPPEHGKKARKQATPAEVMG